MAPNKWKNYSTLTGKARKGRRTLARIKRLNKKKHKYLQGEREDWERFVGKGAKRYADLADFLDGAIDSGGNLSPIAETAAILERFSEQVKRTLGQK